MKCHRLHCTITDHQCGKRFYQATMTVHNLATGSNKHKMYDCRDCAIGRLNYERNKDAILNEKNKIKRLPPDALRRKAIFNWFHPRFAGEFN